MFLCCRTMIWFHGTSNMFPQTMADKDYYFLFIGLKIKNFVSTTRASTHWATECASVLTRVWGWQMVWMCESGSGAGKTPRVLNSVLFVINECGKCVKGWLLSSVPHTKSTACVLYCVISQQPSHQGTLSISRKEAEPQFTVQHSLQR